MTSTIKKNNFYLQQKKTLIFIQFLIFLSPTIKQYIIIIIELITVHYHLEIFRIAKRLLVNNKKNLTTQEKTEEKTNLHKKKQQTIKLKPSLFKLPKENAFIVRSRNNTNYYQSNIYIAKSFFNNFFVRPMKKNYDFQRKKGRTSERTSIKK